MAQTKKEIAQSFVCPKCHGRASFVEDVTLATGPLSRMLPVPNGRYVAASCALCGFTEFYNLAAIATDREKAGKRRLSEQTEEA